LALPAAAAVAAYGAGWWLRLAEPAAAAVLALAGGTVYGYVTEGRRRRFLQRAFSHYLSPAVIERLVEDPSRLELGGERRELSIFFSDLAGFSTLAEGLDPRRLAALLNDYLSAMTELILAEEGTLDKYEGDAIVAFWNAPLDQDDHARRACAAALACQERLAAMAEHFRTRTGGVPLRARIGVHSGEVVVGNLGSRTRFDYTVLGDAANLASRLEGANKAFGSKILVSEATWRATAGAFHGREVGEVVVVGRRQPVRVFEPLAPAAAPPPPWLADWQSALAALRRGELEDARRRFAARPQDPVARAYAERLAALLAEDEPTWDGVWHLDQK
ncbi:MAG: adenylate/guanylate cyclase domain-containing protein, partial [Acidobacteria bacterium]